MRRISCYSQQPRCLRRHMHWHIHPRRKGDTPAPGPVWQLGKELTDTKYNPTGEELEILKKKLNEELDKLLDVVYLSADSGTGVAG